MRGIKKRKAQASLKPSRVAHASHLGQNRRTKKSEKASPPEYLKISQQEPFKPPPRKSNVLNSKVKKTPSKGKSKGTKELKKGVQDIRKFFETGETKNRNFNSTENCALAQASSPGKYVQVTDSRGGIKGNTAQPKNLIRNMVKYRGSVQQDSQIETGLSASTGQH